jgi:hypothetical protein
VLWVALSIAVSERAISSMPLACSWLPMLISSTRILTLDAASVMEPTELLQRRRHAGHYAADADSGGGGSRRLP